MMDLARRLFNLVERVEEYTERTDNRPGFTCSGWALNEGDAYLFEAFMDGFILRVVVYFLQPGIQVERNVKLFLQAVFEFGWIEDGLPNGRVNAPKLLQSLPLTLHSHDCT